MVLAEVIPPAFTNCKRQILDVENTRKLAHVRIHIERIIGNLRQKYRIPHSKLPNIWLQNRKKVKVILDKMLIARSALTNMCPLLFHLNSNVNRVRFPFYMSMGSIKSAHHSPLLDLKKELVDWLYDFKNQLRLYPPTSCLLRFYIYLYCIQIKCRVSYSKSRLNFYFCFVCYINPQQYIFCL